PRRGLGPGNDDRLRRHRHPHGRRRRLGRPRRRRRPRRGGAAAQLPGVTATLAERAAQQRDTVRLMAAVEPLARTRRYGNVRRIDTEVVAPVLSGLLTRVALGLPAAVAAVDDD